MLDGLTASVSAPTDENWHLLSVREVAYTCRLSEKAVRRAIDDGELPAVKLRSRLRITPQDLANWIASGRRTSEAVPLEQPARPRRRPLPSGTFRAMAQRADHPGLEL